MGHNHRPDDWREWWTGDLTKLTAGIGQFQPSDEIFLRRNMSEKLSIQPAKSPGLPTVLASGTFAAWVIFAIITLRSLYGDGSFYLLRVMQAGSFTEMIQNRSYAAYLFQLPAVLALKLGVTDRYWLAVAFGIGCLSAWPICMWMCYRLAPTRFWIVMVACAAGYLNAAFLAVGEHIVAHAFFWPALFALLFVRPLTPTAAVCLLVSAIMLTHSYESLLFLGPILVILTAQRIIQGSEKTWSLLVLGLAGALFILATWIALLAVLFPVNLANFGGFKYGFFKMLHHPPWMVQMSLFFAVLFVLLIFSRVEALLLRSVGLAVLGMAIFLSGAWPFLAPGDIDPVSQHEGRFVNLLVPLALAPLAWIYSVKPDFLVGKQRALVRLSAALLIAQSLWHISATRQWQGYLDIWRHLLATQKGPLNLSRYYGGQTADGNQSLCFDWFWANPTLSLMVGPAKVQALVLPGIFVLWQPFDPLDPKSLPQLGRYGIDYSAYISCLPMQGREGRK